MLSRERKAELVARAIASTEAAQENGLTDYELSEIAAAAIEAMPEETCKAELAIEAAYREGHCDGDDLARTLREGSEDMDWLNSDAHRSMSEEAMEAECNCPDNGRDGHHPLCIVGPKPISGEEWREAVAMFHMLVGQELDHETALGAVKAIVAAAPSPRS